MLKADMTAEGLGEAATELLQMAAGLDRRIERRPGADGYSFGVSAVPQCSKSKLWSS